MKSPQPLESGLAKFLGLTPTISGCGRRSAKLLSNALAGGAALGFVVSLAWPADAASRKSSRHASETKVSKNRDDSKGPFGDMPKGPLQMVVSIGQQHVTLYSNGVRIAQVPVSTGTPGHPTPMGVFSIIQKDRYHHSNLYGNAPMYYMQRITWSGVAMHEGVLPGHAASHGCIRLSHGFAAALWPTTRLGVRVIVARNDLAPAEFNHPKPLAPTGRQAEPPVKRTGHVAVFVSRKERKIFVRQGFAPLFEMPVEIAEPERPLGTHVFTAMGARPEGGGMRWNLISIPTEARRMVETPRHGRKAEPVKAAIV